MRQSFSGFFFFKQKTSYEMRISDWSSDVCSSDLYLKRCALASNIFRPPSRPSHVAPRSAASQQKQCNKCRAQGRRVMKQLRRKQWIGVLAFLVEGTDRKSTRLNSSHSCASRMPSSACKKKKKPRKTHDITLISQQ